MDWDLLDAADEYASYVLPCGHTIDPDVVGGNFQRSDV
jgi:hypothetical protein